jgi:hypothetical protein
MINPGSKKDDEVMYGSGHSDDPVHSGSGLTSTQADQGKFHNTMQLLAASDCYQRQPPRQWPHQRSSFILYQPYVGHLGAL